MVEFAAGKKVWLFSGEMGAGKTTLIKAICEYLGVEDATTSPTFSLVNEYGGQLESTIYHFDFYRIKDESEAMDMGVEEYFDSGNLCLVEWPDKIPSLLPYQYLSVNISVEGKGDRKIILEHHG